jgi:hypothetical protein
MDWRSKLNVDPVPYLLDTDDGSLRFQVRRDILGERDLRAQASWLQPEVRSLVRKQQPDGNWRYPGKRSGENLGEDYEFLQTFKVMALLVECYAMDRTHPIVARAADALFARQTVEGDLRGIYGNQYSPNFTAAALEIIIKAGFGRDKRTTRAFDWLLMNRQSDGGWALPMRTHGDMAFREAMVSDPIPPDKSRPSSYMMTGIVLRAFSADKRRARSREAQEAAEVLKGGFFLPEPYADRKHPSYWTQFTFPFFYNDLISSLDVLSKLGFPGDDQDIVRAVTYFRTRQREDGSLDLKYNLARGKDVGRWVTFSLCRSLGRLYGTCRA